MKQTLIHLSISICFLFCNYSGKGNTYYFSSISGNDSRTTTQAQKSATPWKTLSKLTSFFSSLKPGDSVLFKRGEVFYGSITISASGSAALPIVLSSYGTGSLPIISGLQKLTGWVSVGNGIYESYNSSLGSTVNMVTLNGNLQPVGRYPNINAPNKGYLTFESHNTNSITDNQLTSAINWTGAEAVIKPKRWILDRVAITSHSGKTISFSPALTYNPYDNYGYFIQNHIKTLDQLGEWFYKASTKKMSVYFGSANPSSYSVEASAVGSLVTINYHDNIVFDGLSFKGSNVKDFDLYYAQNISVQGCYIIYSGVDGIYASSTTNLLIRNTYFNYINNNAIDLDYNCSNSIIRYNYVANTGMTPGMGLSGNGTYQGITIVGDNNLVEFNTIYNTGSVPIKFSGGNNNVIKNNFINYFSTIKDDGGGIYTGASIGSNYTGQQIIGNIVLNGIGAPEGTDRPGTGSSSGIYMDDNVANVKVSSNTVANCRKAGIFVHNSFKITLTNNVLYDNATQLIMVHDYGMPNALLRNNIIKNNILFAKEDTQMVSTVSTMANDINLLGVMDSNYFCRPMDDNLTIFSSCIVAGLRIDRYLNLAGWQSNYKLDKASKKTPIQIPNYTINSFAGGNKFSNGGFNSSITGLYTTPSSSWVNNKLDGGSFQATNPNTTLTNYFVIASVGSISSSKNYILKFSSQSSRDTLINAYLRESGAPYSRLTDIKKIQISTKRTENEYLFTLPASSGSASLVFDTKCPKLNFWLDNIELYDANVSQTDPDSYIVFEYNSSQRNKTVSLSGTYKDVYGNIHSGSIVIPPYSSVVLVKQTQANAPYTFQFKKWADRKQNELASAL